LNVIHLDNNHIHISRNTLWDGWVLWKTIHSSTGLVLGSAIYRAKPPQLTVEDTLGATLQWEFRIVCKFITEEHLTQQF